MQSSSCDMTKPKKKLVPKYTPELRKQWFILRARMVKQMTPYQLRKLNGIFDKVLPEHAVRTRKELLEEYRMMKAYDGRGLKSKSKSK